MSTILLVEDNPHIMKINSSYLSMEDYRVFEAADAAQCRYMLSNNDIDLVILDIMLPGEDGVSLLTKIKASSRTKDIPVIMATAKSVEYDKIKSLDLGADDYLVKPFGMMEMVSRIKAVLRRCMPKKENKTKYVNGIIELNVKNKIRFVNYF